MKYILIVIDRETYRASSHALPSTQSHLVPPREWTTMTENQEVQLVPLDPSSNEYSQGEGVFRKTMSGETIHKIERVQNLDLWESYSRYLFFYAHHICLI